MENLLREWELPEDIIEVFKANQIETSQLNDLTNDILKELVPSVGPRLKMLAKIKEMKEQMSVCNASTITVLSENLNENLGENTDASEVNSEFSNNSEQLVTITESTPIVLCNNNNLNNILTYVSTNHYDDFCLRTLLTTSPLGKSVLKYYQTYRKLDTTHRNRLCSIMIKHLYNYITKNRLRQEEYNSLAAKIITLFPTETVGTYYVPPIRKINSPFGKSMMAKGKLVNQVKNIMFRSGDTNKRHIGSDEETRLVPQKIVLNSDIHQNDILWLSHNREPWETVMNKWKITYETRSNENHDDNTITQYIQKWPVLLDIRAPVLINLDFEQKYPSISNIAFWSNWLIFFEKVFSYKKDEIKDALAIDLIDQLLGLNEGDDKFPLQLSILNYMFPPKGRIRTKAKRHWKFSTIESIEGIIKHVKNTGDIEAEIEQTINKAFSRKQSVQPFLLVDGMKAHAPNACYVVLNHDLRYQFKTVSEAFDTLFKLFHTINIKYPSESQHIYQLIQTCVYKINTKFDVVYPDLIDIQQMFQ